MGNIYNGECTAGQSTLRSMYRTVQAVDRTADVPNRREDTMMSIVSLNVRFLLVVNSNGFAVEIFSADLCGKSCSHPGGAHLPLCLFRVYCLL